jgi:hypothetical protein
MKKRNIITEQAAVMDDRTKLKTAAENGCYPKWLKNGRLGTYKGKKVWYGTNDKGNTVIFYADMTAEVKFKDADRPSKTGKWKCQALEQTVGVETPMEQFTPDQQKYIEDLVKYEGVVREKPSDYETNQGKYEVIDLNSKNPTLFPKVGVVMVYKQKGEINIDKPQQDQIIQSYKDRGYQIERPPATESLFWNSINLRTAEDGKYSEYFSTPFFMYQRVQDTKLSDEDVKTVEVDYENQDVEKSLCRQYIQTLYTHMSQNKAMEDTMKNNMKIYVRRCAAQDKIPMFAKSKYEELYGLNPYRNSYSLKCPAGYKLNELKVCMPVKGKNESIESKDLIDNNEVVLKKTIKEGLKNFKDKKKVTDSENKIIENRIKFITEDRNLNSIDDLKIVGSELFEEVMYLRSQGFVSPLLNESLFDFLGGVLGHSTEGVGQFFKEKLVDKVMTVLGVNPDSWIGGVVSTTIGNLELKDISKVFTDCTFTTKLLSKSIAEEAVNQVRLGVGVSGGFYDILSNTLVEMIEKGEFAQSIESKLAESICPMLSDVRQKFTDTEQGLKDKVFS